MSILPFKKEAWNMIFYVTVYIDLCRSRSRSLIIGSGSSQINRLLHAPVHCPSNWKKVRTRGSKII